jgi:hypothetical protein
MKFEVSFEFELKKRAKQNEVLQDIEAAAQECVKANRELK